MITTTGLVKEFYRQSGRFSAAFNVTLSDYSRVDLGVSGDNATNFRFLNGKIYDGYNNFIYSYSAGVELALSGNFSSGKYDLYIDSVPVALGQPSAAAWSNALYVHSTEPLDFEYSLNGQLPDYDITTEFTFNTGQAVLTGNIVNNSLYPIKIYSGDFGTNFGIFSGYLPSGIINAGQTGHFYLYPNGMSSVGEKIVKPTFYTNFGNLPVTINTSGIESQSSNYQITLSGPSLVDNGFTFHYYGEFSTLEGQMSVMPILQHVSGSGIQPTTIDIFADYYGLASGYIVESGYVYKEFVLSGSGVGGVNNVSGTGTITGSGMALQWATGAFTTSVTYLMSGYATGAGYSGLAVGYFTETVGGTIYDGSGSYLFDETRTGAPTSVTSLYPIYNYPATGAIYYNAPDNTMGNDILYVGNLFQGIVYGFHYNTPTDLVNYLNSNTGVHGVSALLSGGDIMLTSISLGDYANTILLEVDSDNNGTMAVSAPTLLGGYSSGYNYPLTRVGDFTGHLNQLYVNSGNYSKYVSGTLTGTTTVMDEVKYFDQIWDMATGDAFGANYSYKEHGDYFFPSGFANSSHITDSRGTIFISVTYNSPYVNAGDVAKLILSGVGAASGVYKEIYITGQRS